MSPSSRVHRHVRQHVVGYLALFIALSGTSYAANKIGSGDIKKNAVLAKHVKDGELSGADVADNGLTGADIDESTLNVLLADGSVTTTKLANAAVTLPKLAFDPATQAELDAVAAGSAPANNSLGAAEPPAADDQIADGSIDSEDLTNGSIVNGDIATTAAIDDAKLATINDAGKVADSALSNNVALLSSPSFQSFTTDLEFAASVDFTVGSDDAVSVNGTRTGTTPGGIFNVQQTNNTTSGFQSIAGLTNNSGTGSTERLLGLVNNDGDPVTEGVEFAGNAFTTAIDASDSDIGTALDVGANDLKTSGATISSTELEKLDGVATRDVNLPLASFFNVTDSATLDFTASDGTSPDFVVASGLPVLEWDADTDGGGANIADIDSVATQFIVPPDYDSAGRIRLTAREISTAGASEQIVCDAANTSGSFGATDTFNLNGVPAVVTGDIDPVVTYVAGGTIVLRCHADDTLGGTTANDVVRLHSASFRYTAAY
jgi:hypothetical protein